MATDIEYKGCVPTKRCKFLYIVILMDNKFLLTEKNMRDYAKKIPTDIKKCAVTQGILRTNAYFARTI
ncbi:hypothetical protein AM500_22640 [Bacillus sp. FJAT-18017]|nr:hypothetical protein AM500_22640 [Bacillus sp. FJAT-18017]